MNRQEVAPLWTPSPERVAASNLSHFLARVNARHGTTLADYDALYAWSVDDIAAFWSELWDFAAVVASAPPTTVLGEERMPGARWFDGARLNFAENLLRHDGDRPALIAVAEAGEPETLTFAELREAVARLAHWLRRAGVSPGDRVAAFLPNRPEAVIGMLAATSLGAVWSSCSPDFGFKGVIDRFGQIEPRVLIACDGYCYNGRDFDSRDRVSKVASEISSIEHVLMIDVLGLATDDVPRVVPWSEALDNDATELVFEQLPFDHPVYIMYSSGTTGVPKCIVHGAGGTLIQHAKELLLHCDLKPTDLLFYYTTCGWMMWNWLVSGLLAGSAVLLFDGSPAPPTPEGRDSGLLWRVAAATGITHFGTSPKFLSMCQKAGVVPRTAFDLARLRTVMSTGSPLSAELFRWVHSDVKADVQVASICGGTDLISCFMLGSPISPVFAGEIQKRGLGMAVEAWDGPGRPVVGHKAELVCTRPFPSMPVGFWNDPDGTRYRSAYFDFFPGVWRHGDFVEITPRGGVIVYGRSDATLNPGGVRIGTAEIYREVESMDEVVDALVVGQRHADDTRIVLFVVLAAGRVLDDELTQRIRARIRRNTTPRHVPAVIVQAPDIPRTISGKKVEIAVTQAIHGEAVANRDAMANPDALDFFTDLVMA